MKGYIIKSNREGGDGRSDIFIYPVSRQEEAFVLEFKVANSIANMPQKAKEAIKQIVDKNYEDELRGFGYTKIKRYGIAFFVCPKCFWNYYIQLLHISSCYN